MKLDLIIREFIDEDAKQVSSLIRETMMKTNINDYPLSILQPLHDYFTPAKIKILASERFCLVAIFENRIVGTGAIENDELKTIFISYKHQKMGIGKSIHS